VSFKNQTIHFLKFYLDKNLQLVSKSKIFFIFYQLNFFGRSENCFFVNRFLLFLTQKNKLFMKTETAVSG